MNHPAMLGKVVPFDINELGFEIPLAVFPRESINTNRTCVQVLAILFGVWQRHER